MNEFKADPHKKFLVIIPARGDQKEYPEKILEF